MRRLAIFLVIASLLGGMMAPVKFVPKTDAPTHLGNFRDAFTSGIVGPQARGAALHSVLGNGLIAVEAAWGANLNSNPELWDWQDITDDVRVNPGINITHGKADETSQAQPANLTFRLDNTTGAYTPLLATGANYPYVTLDTPIRVRVSLDGGNTWTTRFLGFANSFNPGWDTSGNVAVVDVSASGRMRRFGRDALLKSALRRYIEASSPAPVAYWPLEDGDGSVVAASAFTDGVAMSAGGGGSAGAGVKFGVAQGRTQPAYTGFEIQQIATSSFVSLAEGGSLSAPLPSGSGTAWTVQFIAFSWAYTGVAGTNLVLARWFTPGGTFERFDVRQRSFDGFSELVGFNLAGAETVLGATSAAFVDEAHYLITMTQNGGNVDTTFQVSRVISTGALGFVVTDSRAATLAFPTSIILNPNKSTADGTSITGSENQHKDIRFGHLGVWHSSVWYGSAPSFTEVTTVAATGRKYSPWSGYLGEYATDRLIRLCDEEDIRLELNSFEDFEDGLTAFPMTGSWTRDNSTSKSGNWSLRSASIPHNGTSDIVVTVPDSATSMSVWYKVSSESGFDFFRILRDGVQEFETSGEVGWTKRTVSVTGYSQVTFRYIKDGSAVAGSDAAWIDDLSFVISPVLMGAQTSGKFLDLLRECEDADHGVLYDGVGPGLSYISRDSLYNASASLTVDVSAGQLAPPFEPIFDDQRVRNQYTVTRKNGSSATFEQTDGPLGTNTIGTYDSSTTVNVHDDAVNYQHAGWLTHLGTVDGFRYPTLNLNLLASPENAQSWVEIRLFDRIDVTNVSSKATQHPPETVSLVLEGYTEKITPFDWFVTANCAPYAPNVVGELDNTTLRVDCGATRTAEDLDTTETAIDVAIGDTCKWTHADGDYPITIDGEDMTVTAVSAAIGSGSSWTQTLTVTRSVNGVVRAHNSGAEVHVKHPIVSAL